MLVKQLFLYQLMFSVLAYVLAERKANKKSRFSLLFYEIGVAMKKPFW